MGDPAKKKPTYDDVVAAPSHKVAEVVDGELHVSPRPGGPHAGAASALTTLLSGPFRFGLQGPGGWVLLAEPELHLEADSAPVVPDLAGWRRERLPEIPDAPTFELAPDWVCEVLSPSTAALDRASKMPLYARTGVGHAWLVDPGPRTVEVYRNETGGWRLVHTWQGEQTMRAEPFDAVALDLSLVWQR